MSEQVVLVDELDHAIGLMEKLEAHQKGILHRAISVWITDSQGRILLQQRAASKYHSPNLWANACCSHPKEGESALNAAMRRLSEELGIECPLKKQTSFIYRTEVGSSLIEHEFDHLFVGVYEGPFSLNNQEVAAVRYVKHAWLQKALLQQANIFATWIPYVFAAINRREVNCCAKYPS